MTTVKDIVGLISGSDRLIIEKDGEQIYNDWVGMGDLPEEVLAAEAKKLRFISDIKHKNWQAKGLVQPINPEDTPAYSFSDLELRLYYVIKI